MSDLAVLLAGFVLAHAVWSVSDLPEGEALVPLAGIERDGKREFMRFEAETQAEAIDNGKAHMAKFQSEGTTWVFAREGLMRNKDGSAVDVITVEAWQPGMQEPIVFLQFFKPFASGEFKLLGAPVAVVSGKMLPEAEAAPYLEMLQKGIDSHEQVAPLWRSWQ